MLPGISLEPKGYESVRFLVWKLKQEGRACGFGAIANLGSHRVLSNG